MSASIPDLTQILTAFTGRMVVSMRPYKPSEIEEVRNITRPYVETHGEPVAWGYDVCGAYELRNDDLMYIRRVPQSSELPTLASRILDILPNFAKAKYPCSGAAA